MARGVRNRELGFTAKARLPEREATQARIDIARTNLANVPRGVSDRQRDIGREGRPLWMGALAAQGAVSLRARACAGGVARLARAPLRNIVALRASSATDEVPGAP